MPEKKGHDNPEQLVARALDEKLRRMVIAEKEMDRRDLAIAITTDLNEILRIATRLRIDLVSCQERA